MVFEELYKLKIAALLHDPPHKFFVSGRHEKVAGELADRLFGAEVNGLIYDRRIRLADNIASSFERWIMSTLMGREYAPGLFKCEGVKVKNIVTPSLSKETPKGNYVCRKDLYNSYVNELKDIVSVSDNWRLRYHLLYLFYEALWILKGLPWGPADTRVPTRSVFDHDYATAAIIDWTFQDPNYIRGLLVGLDVPGVQEFISSSRKVRDAWISSYIVSALTWYAIVELIDKLGPDALLVPSLRMNPFYLYWLRSKLVGRQSYEELSKSLEDVEMLSYISDKVQEMFEEFGIPPYPIIPGRATLILPSKEQLKILLGIDDLRKYFAERFRKGWKLLWEATRKLAERKAQAEHGDLLWSFIKRVFDYYDETLKDVGFEENPPLGIRVEWVEVSAGSNYEGLWRLYDIKYRELAARLSLAKYKRENPETKLKLYNVTKQAFEGKALGFPNPSGKGFDYCTLCGKLPAIVVLPAWESEEPEKNEYSLLLYYVAAKNDKPHAFSKKIKEENVEFTMKFKKWLNQHRGLLEGFKSVFSPGERLCPWCFLKRVLSLEPRLLKILLIGGDEGKIDDVINEIIEESEKGRTWFPSLAHIASVKLYEKVADLGHDKFIKFIIDKVPELIASYRPTHIKTWTWYFMKEIHRKMHKKVKSLSGVTEEERDLAELITRILIQSDPEDLWFNFSKRSSWSNVLREFGLSKWYWRYYALVRADGDSIGDLLEGKLTAFLAGKVNKYMYDKALLGERIEESEKAELIKFLHSYIVNSYEDKYRRFVEFCFSAVREEVEPSIVEKGKEELARIIAEEGGISVDEALKRINRVINALKEIVARTPKIIVSPSYHVAVSAALTRVASLDIAVVSELNGVVVYAGGDDLMAFMPVDKSLDAVRTTRRGYAGSPINVVLGGRGIRVSLGDGFLQVNNSYLPLLPNVGRSYCIYIAHYHYPLAVVVARSSELLENAKDRCSIKYFDSADKWFTNAKKDVLVIAYNPRATEEHTLIPLTLKRPIVSMNESVGRARDDVSEIACPITFIKKVLKLMDEKFANKGQVKLSRSLLYDASESYYTKTLTTLIEEAEKNVFEVNEALDLSRKLVQAIIRRNAELRREAERLSEELLNLLEESSIPLLALVREEFENSDKERVYPVILSTIGATKLVRSGAR